MGEFPVETFYVMNSPNFGCVKKIASSSALKNSHQNSLSCCFTAVFYLTPNDPWSHKVSVKKSRAVLLDCLGISVYKYKLCGLMLFSAEAQILGSFNFC